MAKPGKNKGGKDDVLKDWADKLASSPPVSRVRLLVRPGRTGDWSLVRGVSVTIPELPGNSITNDDLEGMAAEFQDKAEEHFATLTTTLGTQAKRADYKLEALHIVEDKEVTCWETAVYTAGDTGKPTERDVAVERGIQDINIVARMTNEFLKPIEGLTSLVEHQMRFTDNLNEKSNRRLERAAAHDLALHQINADRDIEVERQKTRREISDWRNRTVRHLVNSVAPLARRALDLGLIFAARKAGAAYASTPDTLQEHCLYVAEHFELVAPVLASAGVNDQIIHAMHDAVATAGNTGDFDKLLAFRETVTIPHEQLQVLVSTIARLTGDRQLAESLYAVWTYQAG